MLIHHTSLDSQKIIAVEVSRGTVPQAIVKLMMCCCNHNMIEILSKLCGSMLSLAWK